MKYSSASPKKQTQSNGISWLCWLLCPLIFVGCGEIKDPNIQSQQKSVEAVQILAPKALYESLDGTPVQLSQYHGKRLFVNYWATWCKPCIEEMPALEELQSKLSDREYVFLFASDQATNVIQKFKAAKGFDLTFVKFNGTWADEGISALPVSIIYNRMGEQVHRFDGAMDWDSPEIIEKLKSIP